MNGIPLHLQRRFEQRWAARFVSPVASAAPKIIGLKGAFNSLPRPVKAKAKEKPAGAGLKSASSGVSSIHRAD
jgi:hypothetical protein